MSSVLVLNQDFTPISTCSVERAFLLLFLQKADIMSADKNKALRSVSTTYPYPSVIKIKTYIHIPYQGVILTRHNIFKRDNHSCQYCGTNKDLTLDHLIPKSKGGKSTWTNLVTACQRCNSKKGDNSPAEAGMKLSKIPEKPTYLTFMRSTSGLLREDWRPYLQRKASA